MMSLSSRSLVLTSLVVACASDPSGSSSAPKNAAAASAGSQGAGADLPSPQSGTPPIGGGGPDGNGSATDVPQSGAPQSGGVRAGADEALIRPDPPEALGVCGDGVLDDREACDDGNQLSDDGCHENCLFVEQGFVCKPAEDGAPQTCIPFARCGDGVPSFPEQCDDGGSAEGDGCDANCKLELGFKCSGQPSVCEATQCGDGIIEGTEMCEPGVDQGCTSQCQFAPDCSGDGPCTSVCGDGIVLDEACDDGNVLPGDGCDERCEIEPGYSCELQVMDCEQSELTGECILRVPVTYRDFDATHSDFESDCAGSAPTLGLVQSTLVAQKPVATGEEMCTSGFADWYSDGPSSTAYPTELVLYDDGDGNYVNRYGENGEAWFTSVGTYQNVDCTIPPHCGPFYGSPFFFPVDGIPDARGDGGSMAELATTEYGLDGSLYSELALTGSAPAHNFSFTSEVAYWFAYNEDTNATLRFTGDDDVWVFINGLLALDLGGLHPAVAGEVTVSGADDSFVGGTGAAHQMTPGNVYPVKVFHAERHTTGSTFRLTLSGFLPVRSSCQGECGNGSVEYGEECDDGELNEDAYNHCGTDCRLTEFCGDGKVTDGEACDDAIDDLCFGCRTITLR